MDLEDWHCFMAAARLRSITEAAKELYLAQPTLTKRIKSLERSLGVALFERRGRSVQLTAAGEVLFAEGLTMVPREERLRARLAAAAGGKQGGRLYLAVLGTAGWRCVPAVQKLQAQYKEADIHIEASTQRKALQQLEEGIADVAVALDFGMEFLRDIESRPLYGVGISLVLPENHWFLKEKQKDFGRLRDEPFLLFSSRETPESTAQAREILASWGIPAGGCREVSSLETALLSIAAGLGLAILPDDAAMYAGEGIHFLSIPEKKRAVRVVAAWKKKNYNPLIPVLVRQLDGGMKVRS